MPLQPFGTNPTINDIFLDAYNKFKSPKEVREAVQKWKIDNPTLWRHLMENGGDEHYIALATGAIFGQMNFQHRKQQDKDIINIKLKSKLSGNQNHSQPKANGDAWKDVKKVSNNAGMVIVEGLLAQRWGGKELYFHTRPDLLDSIELDKAHGTGHLTNLIYKKLVQTGLKDDSQIVGDRYTNDELQQFLQIAKWQAQEEVENL